jgi:pyruvate dehydrogenase E2 component (dihydrolipoamide acetyltransferase)
MDIELKMPILDETMKEGVISEWYKKEGDFIEMGEPIVSVETDKTNIDVESFISGRIKKILVVTGETAKVGNPIAIITQ